MKRHLTDEERRLWQRFTADVARTEQSAILLDDAQSENDVSDRLQHAAMRRPHNVPLSAQERSAASAVAKNSPLQDGFNVPAEWFAPLTERNGDIRHAVAEPLLHRGQVAGVDGGQARRFQRGKLGVDATLDLHGYRQAAAQEAFTQFVMRMQQAGARVLCVITGHGKMRGSEGVLKAALPRWINLPENRMRILSYDQARPEHGGQGAVMLLLRKPAKSAEI